MKSINFKTAKQGWKSTVMVLSTALCVGAMAPNAFAQSTRANADINWSELSAFDAFLDQHPIMADQLSTRPGLVRNEEYLEDHPALSNFLKANPSVGEELDETPARFMQREAEFRQLERTSGVNRVELGNLDRYLDSHPEVARELQSNPGLADNREYREQHPELRVFLVKHPGVWSQFRAHPKWLMFREGQFESSESAGASRRHPEKDRDDMRNRKQSPARPEGARPLPPAFVHEPNTRAEERQELHGFPLTNPGIGAEVTTHSNAAVTHERMPDQQSDGQHH